MLSQSQQCTNQTGSHQSRQTTPTDTVISPTFQSLERNGQDIFFDYTRDAWDTQRQGSNTDDRGNGVNRQHSQQNLQTSQELNAQPGGNQTETGGSQQRSTQQSNSKTSGPFHGSIPENDMDALLRGLEPDTPFSNHVTPHAADHASDYFEHVSHEASRVNSQTPTRKEEIEPCLIAENEHNTLIRQIEVALSPDTMDTSEEISHPVNTEIMLSNSTRDRLLDPAFDMASPKLDPNATIKASSGRRIIIAPVQEHETAESRSPGIAFAPTRAARHSVDFSALSSPDFLDMSNIKADMPVGRGGYNPDIYSPLTNSIPSNIISLQSSPETPTMTLFADGKVDNIVMDAQRSFMRATQIHGDAATVATLVQHGQHARSKSFPDIDLDDCVRDTGVTTEEIASFIQGPDPDDQKWACLFEETRGRPCGKRFARKENAKSHVQTHLGDRQFVCKVCQTPFVRQHDLKRHFKIHTIEKAHRCPCGKDFHRHDALTRHRQRGMCVGAFGGTPKKVVKRGRPKKTRPSTEERSEKAAKTRQYVMERTKPGSTYASSISGSSEYSAASPRDFDNFSVTASSPSLSHKGLDDHKGLDLLSQPLTPPTSPERAPDMLYMPPSAYETISTDLERRSLSPQLDMIPEHAATTSLPYGQLEHYQNSPPELDLSSSSPATSQIFDFSTYGEQAVVQMQEKGTDNAMRPQIFSQDFQLFTAAPHRDAESMVKFEDFLDFSNIDSNASENHFLKTHSGMVTLQPDKPAAGPSLH